MTEFNLGVLSAYATIDDAPFNAAYPRLVAKFRAMFGEATKAAAGLDKLDASLAEVADASSAASASLSRVSTSTTQTSAAQTKAAAQAKVFADAQARVGAVMSTVTADAQRLQQAELRLIAAQERYNTLVESGAASTAQLASAQAGLIGAERSLFRTQEQIAGRMSTLTGSMDAQAASAARLEAIMARYAGASVEVRQAALREAAAQEDLNRVQESGVATTRQLAQAQASLIGAQRSLAAAQAAGAVSGGRFAASMGRVGKAGKTLNHYLAIPLAAISILSVKAATDFDASMTRIQTQAGATSSDVRVLTSDVLAMKNAQFGPNALAGALYHLKSVGLDNAAAMKALKASQDLAAVGGANLEDTTNALAGAWRSGIKGAGSFAHTAATVNAIIGAGNMTLADFTEGLSTGILPAARTFGVSLQSIGAALSVFTDEGVPANVALTRMRMTLSLLGAPTAKATKLLDGIGLSSTQLAKDMRTGPNGLLNAVSDLKDHLSGLTKVQVAQFLSQAFGGGRSSSAIMTMLNQVGLLGKKWDQVTGSIDKYGNAVRTQAATPAAKFHQAVAELQKAGVLLGNELLPIATQFAHALTTLASGFNDMSSGQKHFVVEVGVALLVLGPMLSLIGRIGKAIAFMWAVGKGALAFTAGMRGAALAEGQVASKAYLMGSALRSVNKVGAAFIGLGIGYEMGKMAQGASKGAKAMAVFGGAASGAFAGFLVGGPIGAAIGGVTGLLGGLAGAFGGDHGAAARAAELQANIESLTGTLKQDGGAVGQYTRAWEANKLATDGVIGLLPKLGVSLDTATRAALGSKSAIAEVTAAATTHGGALSAEGAAARYTAGLILGYSKALVGAEKQNRQEAKAARAAAAAHWDQYNATHRNVDAVSRLAGGLQNTTGAMHGATAALRGEKGAADGLGVSFKKLTKDLIGYATASLGMAQSEDQFQESVRGLSQQLKGSHDQLNITTKAGLANRDAFINAATSALSLRDSQRKAGVSIGDANVKLLDNIKQLRGSAIQAGATAGSVDKLLGRYHLLPRQIRTLINADTSQANAALFNLTGKINGLVNGYHQVTLTVVEHGGIAHGNAGAVVPGKASGGSLPEGVSVVGEGNGGRGTELAVKHGSNVQIVPHGPAMNYLRATGARIQGFAGGTLHPGAQTAVTKASAALTSVSLDKSGFSWMRFAQQIATAAQAVKDAIAAGATKAQIASLQARLARDRTEGAALERALGHSVMHGFAGLGYLIGQVQTPGAHGKMLGKLSSRSDVRSALGTVEQQLRQAGLPKSFIKGLDGENAAILATVASRNIAARHLAAANKALGDAQAKLHGDQKSFAGAISGSFDVTGQVDDNGRVTAGGEVAAANQAVTRARAFVTGMKKLIGLKIFPNRYLRTLLSDGPTPEALATVRALAGMPRADQLTLAADNRQLSKLGHQLGNLGAGRLDQGAVDRAQRRVDHYQKIENQREKHLHHELTHLADRIESKLDHLNLLAKLDFNKGQLALATRTGQSQNNKATRSGTRPGGRA